SGALPVNLRFAFDGEEEIGGRTIADWVAQDERGADAAVIFDGGMLRRDVPVIELATRGLVGFDVKVRTGARDLHSGMYGGVALNAIHVLMSCLDAVLAGPDGRLPEPLRAGIAAPTADEAAPEGAELGIVWAGSNPGLVRADAPAVQLAVEAFEQGLGIRPLLTRVGGSIPLMPALTEKGIDTILTGFGLPESNIHSPNERFLVTYFAAGIDTAAARFAPLGGLNG